MLFRERRYSLIVADTETQASLFLGQIKQIINESEEIHQLFGLKLNEKNEVDFKKTQKLI